MSLFRSYSQIPSKIIINPKNCLELIDRLRNANDRSLILNDKKFVWSWCRDNEPKPLKCCDTNVRYANACRRRIPQCPEFITSGEPSKCLEYDYGKRKRKLWFFGSKRNQVVVKEKPSNCVATKHCKKPITFTEYIFGEEKPLPDPNTCRMAWKIKQMSNSPHDPRLDDPRYQRTKGDVFLFTETPKLRSRASSTGPKYKIPISFRPPNSVLCKRFSDSVSGLDCYCAYLPLVDKENCQSNLCPVHKNPFKLPYEEMRPQFRRKNFFTCKQGISTEDVALPPRRESCDCVHSDFSLKKTSPPNLENCAFLEELEVRGKAIEDNEKKKREAQKISRCERLKIILMEKEASYLSVPQFMRMVNIELKAK